MTATTAVRDWYNWVKGRLAALWRWQTASVQIPGLPTPPTDNYHKFRAVAGLWILLGTLAGLGFAFFHFMRLTFDLKLKEAVARVELGALSMEIEEFEREVRTKGTSLNVEESRKALARLSALNQAHAKERAKIDVAVQQHTMLGVGLIVMIIAGGLIALCGLLLAALGFWSWRRIQAVQDEYLLRQLDSLKAPE